MPYGDVLDRLTAGPAAEIVRVTIPEGLSRREIAPIVGARGRARQLPARERRHVARSTAAGYAVPAGAESLEGFLFPATYELRRRRAGRRAGPQAGRPPSSRTSSRVDLSYARSKNLTVYDVVTIASMVEREVQVGARAPAGRGRDLQPPEGRASRSGSTPRSATRPATGPSR